MVCLSYCFCDAYVSKTKYIYTLLTFLLGGHISVHLSICKYCYLDILLDILSLNRCQKLISHVLENTLRLFYLFCFVGDFFRFNF